MDSDKPNKSLKGIIASNIVFFRKYRNLGQEDLGIALGYNKDTAQGRISQYETLKRSPGKQTLQKMADAFAVDVTDLITPWEESEYRCLELFRQARASGSDSEFMAAVEMAAKLIIKKPEES